MKFPWVRAVESTVSQPALTEAERIQKLEFRMDQLEADWQEVLERITKRYRQQAAEAKKNLVAMIDAPQPPAAVPGANGTDESAIPQLDEYGRVSKRWLMAKAQKIGKGA